MKKYFIFAFLLQIYNSQASENQSLIVTEENQVRTVLSSQSEEKTYLLQDRQACNHTDGEEPKYSQDLTVNLGRVRKKLENLYFRRSHKIAYVVKIKTGLSFDKALEQSIPLQYYCSAIMSELAFKRHRRWLRQFENSIAKSDLDSLFNLIPFTDKNIRMPELEKTFDMWKQEHGNEPELIREKVEQAQHILTIIKEPLENFFEEECAIQTVVFDGIRGFATKETDQQ